MKIDFVKKGLVAFIIVLFLGMSIMPIPGSLSMQNHVSIEKSLADCSVVKDSNLSLVTVMYVGQGDGDYWYGINNNFTMTYQSDRIASMYYSLDGVWTDYTNPFVASEDGDHALEWYASDYEGNKSEVDGPFSFGIDQTPPEIEITYDWSGNKEPYLFTFTATAADAHSGMERVEFYQNGIKQYTVYGPGPEYIWSIYWVPMPHQFFRAYAYDMAGNDAFDDIIEPCDMEVLESPIFSTGIIGEQDNNQKSKNFVPKTEIVGKVSELYREKPKSDCSMDDAFDIASLVVVVNRRMLNDFWVGSDVKINISPDPDDITAVYYKLDDGEWILYTEPLVFSKDGFHRFWWYIVDDEGEISTPDSIVFNMDRTPPTINFTKEKIEENKIKFTANVSDETSGVDRVDFYVDGKFGTNFSSPPYEWIYNGSGRHIVTAVVYDKAGDSNSSSLNTWHSKSDQQTVSIPRSQNDMSVVSSTGNDLVKQSVKTTLDGNILYVGGAGEGNYTKIQDAIDNATDRDTLFVYDDSSPYYENVVVDKSISLVGEDKNNTIIDGGGSGVIIINFDEVTVSDFTIQNSGNDSWNEAGIKIYSNHTIIIDNIISNNGDGIHLDSSISNIITDNIILNNRNSIYLEDSSNTNINGNNALNNLYGIYLESSSNNNIINGNNALNNFCGISISSSSNNIIMGNNVSNNTYGISLFASSNNIIMGNNASNNFGGISFSSSKNNNITGNNASNNHNGISLSDYSNSNIIIGNNISWNLLGIYLYISCSIIINNNLICNNIQSRFENIPGYYFLSTWWDGNYWNKSRTLPKPIFGTLTIALIFYRNIVIPWIAFDWHPAKEPYDIGV